MRELRIPKIITVNHGYGNMKTANTVTPTKIKAYEIAPIFNDICATAKGYESLAYMSQKRRG